MKRRIKYQWAALFIISAIILLPAISSFADTTTYEYDDTNHKIRVESGVANPNPTYSISGIVTNASDGSPLSGVTITLGSSQATTDSNGFYIFSGKSNGTYIVSPTQGGYTFSPSYRSVTVNGTDAIAQNFTATLAPIFSISGTVTSSGTGLSGVTMTLSGTASGATTTDASGNYTFSSLTNGSYTVTPDRIGYTFAPVNGPTTINGANVTGRNFTANASSPPSSPSGLIATLVSSVQINLSWMDNSINEAGFKIERKPSGGTYSQITQVGANVTTYPDSGLAANTTYYYRVKAYNGMGDSGYSNEANATTLCPNLQVRIAGATPVYYSTLQAAYNAAVNGSIIQSRSDMLTENVSINRNISVTLQGGYDCGYTTNSGNVTNFKGMIQTTTGGGTLTISNFNLTQ